MNVLYPIDRKILRSEWSKKNPLPFTSKDIERNFPVQPAAIRQALARLVKAGKLRRIRRGFYERPRAHPLLGQTAPNPLAVVESVMRARGASWEVGGAHAANLLGLSEQVPAQLVIKTTASIPPINLGKALIKFERVTPSRLLGTRGSSRLVIQAIRHLGVKNVSPRVIAQLRAQLKPKTKHELGQLSSGLPRWMQPIILEIAAELVVHERPHQTNTQATRRGI
jgi:hypothetical protein